MECQDNKRELNSNHLHILNLNSMQRNGQSNGILNLISSWCSSTEYVATTSLITWATFTDMLPTTIDRVLLSVETECIRTCLRHRKIPGEKCVEVYVATICCGYMRCMLPMVGQNLKYMRKERTHVVRSIWMIIYPTKKHHHSVLSNHLHQQMRTTRVFVDEGAHIMDTFEIVLGLVISDQQRWKNQVVKMKNTYNCPS